MSFSMPNWRALLADTVELRVHLGVSEPALRHLGWRQRVHVLLLSPERKAGIVGWKR